MPPRKKAGKIGGWGSEIKGGIPLRGGLIFEGESYPSAHYGQVENAELRRDSQKKEEEMKTMKESIDRLRVQKLSFWSHFDFLEDPKLFWIIQFRHPFPFITV